MSATPLSKPFSPTEVEITVTADGATTTICHTQRTDRRGQPTESRTDTLTRAYTDASEWLQRNT